MRLDFATPRKRLVATSTAMLLGALLILSASGLMGLRSVIRSSADSRLMITAEAIEALADYGKRDIHLDGPDIRQFNRMLALQVNGAVFDRSGAQLVSSVSSVPADIERVATPRTSALFETVGQNGAEVRVYVRPVMHRGQRFGTIVVWRADEWSRDVERAMFLTLAFAIVAIGVFGALIIDRVSRHALDNAIERQRRFTADASHELRTPLSVIRAETDLAIENDCSAAEHHEALRSIQQEVERMTVLIDDMLTTARAGINPQARRIVDLSSLCATVCQRLVPLSARRDIALACHSNGSVPVLGDESSLACAVAALVHNAIKYAPQHGNVDVRVRTLGERAEVSICDNGSGFGDAALAHAFERFWRDDSVRTRGAGTGLGLAIAKAIVDSHNGRIELSNPPGGGAEVRCVLPVKA